MANNSICNGIIAQGLPQGDCANLPAKGYERLAVLVNREDIDFANVEMSESYGNVVTALGLKEGKTGYEVHQMGSAPFTGTSAALESNDYYKSVTKTLVIAVINNDRDVYGKFVDPLLLTPRLRAHTQSISCAVIPHKRIASLPLKCVVAIVNVVMQGLRGFYGFAATALCRSTPRK